MIRTAVKGKTQRSKRELEKRGSKIIENTKRSLVMKGNKVSEIVSLALKDLHAMKKPDSILFQRNNDIHPFDSLSSMEFLCKSNDCSLFAFGSHSKKRQHNLVFGRTFDAQVIDMFEFGIDEATFIPMMTFESHRSAEAVARLGSKPMIQFLGDEFEQKDEYKALKNFLLDYFRGESLEKLDLTGLDRVITVAVSGTKVLFRHYALVSKNSGSKTPRVELEEVGPHMDLNYRRKHSGAPELCAQSLKQAKNAEQKLKKNQEIGLFKEKLGRLHMKNQDLSQMATAKMKGLGKRKSAESGEDQDQEMEEAQSDVEADEDEAPTQKKSKGSR